MFDARIRKYIDQPLNRLARFFIAKGISANQITITSFFIGMSTLPLLAFHHYLIALVCILINRLGDGLDGAIARQTKTTHTGAYLDIVLDFIFYSGVIFGFALAQPQNAVYAALLIFSFIGTGSSFLAFAIFAEKLNLQSSAQAGKSFYYLEGLAEGTETILVLCAMCLFPHFFWVLALGFSVICILATIIRVLKSIKLLSSL
ncbi:MAG: CDP-alcohol phosphatidyltransferase family protein [Pseudomonadales bacterium]|nr:CDP-alcohol phosphatidyltransferase family protein [Pseudomonadales bacterium]